MTTPRVRLASQGSGITNHAAMLLVCGVCIVAFHSAAHDVRALEDECRGQDFVREGTDEVGTEESLLCVPHVLVINLARRVDKWFVSPFHFPCVPCRCAFTGVHE